MEVFGKQKKIKINLKDLQQLEEFSRFYKDDRFNELIKIKKKVLKLLEKKKIRR